jgi:hypothetical protein
MDRIALYSPARQVGRTVLAAHLFYFLQEHGVRCCASDEPSWAERPLELAARWGIPAIPREPVCFETLPRMPLEFGVHVYDLHAERQPSHDGELGCYRWVIPMNDLASFEQAIAAAQRLSGTVLLVWNGADDATRRRVTLPGHLGREGRVAIATSAIPRSELIHRADQAAVPVWRIPGGARSSAGRAVIRVLLEIVGRPQLQGLPRHVGFVPPGPTPCGHCLLCDYYRTNSAA